MIFPFETTPAEERYKIMSACIIPRPIAWVMTEYEGVSNLAPFSYFAPLSSKPPAVIVSVGHKKDGSPKDTLHNIRKNGKATIHLVGESFGEKLQQTSQGHDLGESECEIYGIATEKASQEHPPMVQDANIALFCSFLQEVPLEGSQTIPLILRIDQVHVHDSHITPDGKIIAETIGRVSREYLVGGERKSY